METQELLTQLLGEVRELSRRLGSMEGSPEWLNIDEAAAYLKIKPSTIHMKTSRGSIPHHKIGGKLLFDKKELDNFIKN